MCEERLYDQHFLVSGAVRKLNHDYIDVVCSDLTTWVRRHVRWQILKHWRCYPYLVHPMPSTAAFGNPFSGNAGYGGSTGGGPLFLRRFYILVTATSCGSVFSTVKKV